MRVGVRGIGWVGAAGMGSGRDGGPFALPPGDLPCIARRAVFPEPDPRFGRLDPYSMAGLAAITFALRDGGLEAWSERRAVAVVASTVHGCLGTDLAFYETVLPGDGALASPNLFAYSLPHCFVGEAAIRFGLTGPTYVVTDGAAAGMAALGEACLLLHEGDCPQALAGVCDLPLPPALRAAGPAPAPGAVFVLLDGGGGGAYGALELGAGGQIRYKGRAVRSVETLAAACLAGSAGRPAGGAERGP